jgi:hypothetical protein
MLSTHQLAPEKLRCTDHALQRVPRHERVCGFYKTVVESPEHALLECQHSPKVLNLGNIFLPKLFRTAPNLQMKMGRLSHTEFLRTIIYEHSTTVLVEKYVHEFLEVFYTTPVYRVG